MRHALTDTQWTMIQPVFPGNSRGAPAPIIDVCSMASPGYCAMVRGDVTYPTPMVLTKPATIGSFDGKWQECGMTSWTRSQTSRTPKSK